MPATAMRAPEQASDSREADHAAQITSVYNTVLQRNPDAGGLLHHVKLLAAGVPLENISHAIASSPEAAALAARGSLPGGTSAWKAEDRPIRVDDGFSILQIELTNKCPFRCVMCPRTEHMTRNQGNMSFETFRKIIDELVALDPDYGTRQDPIWLHHFGESLVHPRFADCIRYARTRGVRTRMSINPLMLSEGIGDDLLEAEPVELQVSLDGHDDESFEKIRGLPDVYEQSRRNLIRFLEKKVARGKKIHMTLSVIDFPLNDRSEQDHRAEWEGYWRSIPGIDTFLWKGFCSWNGDTPEITDLDRVVHSEAGHFVRQHRAGFKVTCDWPWKRMVVAWNGDVLSCCYDYDAKYVLGNVARQSLAEIWNGAPMQALRREFAGGCVTNSLCANCEYLRA
jgi:radical SAM protein with 4Fe4S-binding SPASM domain